MSVYHVHISVGPATTWGLKNHKNIPLRKVPVPSRQFISKSRREGCQMRSWSLLFGCKFGWLKKGITRRNILYCASVEHFEATVWISRFSGGSFGIATWWNQHVLSRMRSGARSEQIESIVWDWITSLRSWKADFPRQILLVLGPVGSSFCKIRLRVDLHFGTPSTCLFGSLDWDARNDRVLFCEMSFGFHIWKVGFLWTLTDVTWLSILIRRRWFDRTTKRLFAPWNQSRFGWCSLVAGSRFQNRARQMRLCTVVMKSICTYAGSCFEESVPLNTMCLISFL